MCVRPFSFRHLRIARFPKQTSRRSYKIGTYGDTDDVASCKLWVLKKQDRLLVFKDCEGTKLNWRWSTSKTFFFVENNEILLRDCYLYFVIPSQVTLPNFGRSEWVIDPLSVEYGEYADIILKYGVVSPSVYLLWSFHFRPLHSSDGTGRPTWCAIPPLLLLAFDRPVVSDSRLSGAYGSSPSVPSVSFCPRFFPGHVVPVRELDY